MGTMTEDPLDSVIGMVARKAGVPTEQITRATRLVHDLHIDGDDATELVLEIRNRYELDMSEFDASQFFRSEPTLLSWLPFLPSQKRDRLENKRPLTVGDLVDAVQRGRF